MSLALATLTVGSLSAQKSKLVSAYNYNKSYERDKDCSELEKGIEAIELVTKNESTAKLLKTWYYGGNLYFNAALAPDPECSSKFPGSLDKSYSFYIEAIKYNIDAPGAAELDLTKEADQIQFASYIMNRQTKYNEISYMRDILGQKFPYLANAFVNRGVEEFQTGNFEKAFKYSQNSVEVNAFLGKVDSLGLFNSALAAERLKNYDQALELYTALTAIKYGGPNIHLYIANIYDARKDTVKKIEAIRNGLKQYPDNADLIREELNYLLITGQTDEALANFDKAIANDPENPAMFYNRGLINDQVGNKEAAAADYKKAFELEVRARPVLGVIIGMTESELIKAIGEPQSVNNTKTANGVSKQMVYKDNLFVYIDDGVVSSVQNKSTSQTHSVAFDAMYNLGAMYYNDAVEWNNKASNYGLNETAKYKEASTKANEYFELALPALEKAHEIDPEDRITIASLTKIYAMTSKEAKYLEMKKKLDGK